MTRSEFFKTKDNRSYTLWADINNLATAVIPTYLSQGRDRRRERGWMFRGQSNSDWDLLPSLYRPPSNDRILELREEYTQAFIAALKREARTFGLEKLDETQYLAVAQHYGLYTDYLDFTWNVEVASYFASAGSQSAPVGAIFAFSAHEYEQIRNPFASLGSSKEESDRAMRQAGMEPLPDLELVELYNVPRIYAQEGIFIRVPPESAATLMHECIDRFYFRQRSGRVYGGDFPHREHMLLEPDAFDSRATYDSYIAIAQKEHPEVFDRTPRFNSATLFPPADPISKFVERWKREHADPAKAATPTTQPPSVAFNRSPRAERFAAQVDAYYYGDFPNSPYKSQFLTQGRELLESLRDLPQLDDDSVQRWLLWELLKRNVPAGLTCVLKLGNSRSWGAEEDGFRVTAVDRWLQASFPCTLTREQLAKGFWEITFGRLEERGRPVKGQREIQAFALPDWRAMRRTSLDNPHQCSHAADLLVDIESKLAKLDDGIVGSFLFDFHHAVMMAMGRDLHLIIGLAESAPCFERSPLVRPEHANGPALFVRITDGFTGGVTDTAVCEKHWDHLCEGETDLMHPQPMMVLGLA